MIISHKYKYIFIKSFKTASTSLEIALSKYCGKEDVITPIINEDEKIRKMNGFNGPQNFGDNNIFHEHMSALEIKSNVSEEIWNNYFKFVVVRNPFDQIMSAFHWHNKSKEKEKKLIFFKKRKKTFEDFFKIKAHHIFEDEYNRYTEYDNVLVDLFIKYENFKKDLTELSEKLSFPENIYETFSNINAKSNIRPSNSMIEVNNEINDKIKVLAKKIIKMHNY